MKADFTLDTFGLLCPMPIVKTSKELKKMNIGQVLKVISSDEGIKEDMPAFCKSTGHQFLGLEENNGEFIVYVKKTK